MNTPGTPSMTCVFIRQDLLRWASGNNLATAVQDRPAEGGQGPARRVAVTAGRGTVSVDFRETPPHVVVEWGGGYRGEFPDGLPSGGLTGLLGGLLGIGKPAA